MSTSTSSRSFLTLPPEIRIKVYHQILSDSADTLTPRALETHCGLILSCKQIKSEFENEWVKPFNVWLTELAKNAGFRPMALSADATLRDACHIVLLFPNSPFSSNSPLDALRYMHCLIRLTIKLKAYFLRPDISFPPLDNTPRSFINSIQFKALRGLSGDLMGVHYMWMRDTVVFVDYWRHEISISRTSSMVDQFEPREVWPLLFNGKCFRNTPICQIIIESCSSMEELKEYRGLMYASRGHYEAFLRAWRDCLGD